MPITFRELTANKTVRQLEFKYAFFGTHRLYELMQVFDHAAVVLSDVEIPHAQLISAPDIVGMLIYQIAMEPNKLIYSSAELDEAHEDGEIDFLDVLKLD